MSRLQILKDRLSTLTTEVTECSEYRNELIIVLNEIDYSVANRAYIDSYLDEYYAAEGQTWHWMKYDWSVASERKFKAIAEYNE